MERSAQYEPAAPRSSLWIELKSTVGPALQRVRQLPRPGPQIWREQWRSILAGVAVSALTLGLVVAPIDHSALGSYGYLGVFVVTLLATASLVLPVPYLGVIVVAGSFLNPLLVALVAGGAAAVGELTGYVAGVIGRALLRDRPGLSRVFRLMERYGGPAVFVAALLPNPFFDAVGLAAGVTRLPIGVFLLACFVGKALRFWALAALGDVLPL